MLKRVLCGFTLVGLLGGLVLGLVSWWTAPVPGVTPENFKYLRWGMTRGAVERLLGQRGVEMPDGDGEYYWHSPDCQVLVTFDKDDGRVEEARLYLTPGMNTADATTQDQEPALLDVIARYGLRRALGW